MGGIEDTAADGGRQTAGGEVHVGKEDPAGGGLRKRTRQAAKKELGGRHRKPAAQSQKGNDDAIVVVSFLSFAIASCFLSIAFLFFSFYQFFKNLVFSRQSAYF